MESSSSGFEVAYYTDIGKRERNEDSVGVTQHENSLLAVVADGVGGHVNGKTASLLAVDTLIKDFLPQEMDEDVLGYQVLKANAQILAADNAGQSTIAVLWAEGSHAIAAHVGDSRVYQFRDGKIIFQTVDHSAVQMAVLTGELEPEALRHHKDRNKIFRALGDPTEAPKIDSSELTVSSGDRFLLCSDGFWEPVTEEKMVEALQDSDTAEQWLEALKAPVASAQDPKQDNYTAICIFVK